MGRDGAIGNVNLAGSSLLGIERSRLIGRDFGLLVASADRPAFRGFLLKVFNSKSAQSCEVALRHGGGRPSFVQIETVVAASGRDCHAVIIDISLRRNSEKVLASRLGALVMRAAQQEDANLELEAFNRTISHELCTPLATIHGYGEVLGTANKGRLDDRSLQYLRGISDGTLRMKHLITSLLDFSRVARVGLELENFDLSAMAHAAASKLGLAQPDGRVSFRVPEGLTMNGDAGLCGIVLDNLIGNAWKQSLSRADTVIEVGMTEFAGRPICFLCDNGAGFDVAEVGRLFTPFQRIPEGEALGHGHGIGLATVKRIVKRHGGRVWAESCPGEGATFFLTLE